MKNVLKTTMMMVAVLFSAYAAYATSGTAKVTVNSDNTLTLRVTDISENFDIRLLDENGKILYKNQVENKTTFNSKFDVNFLPNGNYTLELQDETRVQEFAIALLNNTIMVNQGKTRKTFKPSIGVQENLISLNMLVLNEEATVQVYMYDNTHREVMSDTIIGTNHFGRQYSMAQLPKGTYNMAILAQGRTYNKVLVKE